MHRMNGNMMQWIARLLAAAVMLSSSVVSHAASGPWTTIAQIYTRTGPGTPFIYLAPGAMPGCFNDRGGYLRLMDQSNHDKTYSTLLSALIADREVQIFYEFTGTTSGWGMCNITAVYIR